MDCARAQQRHARVEALWRELPWPDGKERPEALIVAPWPVADAKWLVDDTVTIGVQVGKNPDTGIRNLSVHRMLVLGKDRLGADYFVRALRGSAPMA